MSDDSNTSETGSAKLMHFGMMACCAIMLLPVAAYFVGGGSLGGLLGNGALFLPLLLCVGAHFVMHKMTGKSCHGSSEDEQQATSIPLLTDNRMKEPQSQRL